MTLCRLMLSVCLALGALTGAVARRPSALSQPVQRPLACSEFPRPPYTEYARVARWLVHQTTWGEVSTTSRHLGGMAFGHVVSHADGPCDQPTGRLLFYLTSMDATAQDLQANSSASLALSEGQLAGACTGVDPEDPTCAKLSISGRLEPVPEEGQQEAQALLFPRHPHMRDWPSGHAFRVYELHISTLRLLDWYGGPHDLSPEQYFAADLLEPATAEAMA
ncbi:CREG1 [Micractinium conductrix]|uniref:CREG1 n=1 Tax=Micractinium conductrix TaxID=554055 RepID=A0A2P6VG94_9CHLO|nr:CREG1 [Micractinium conductrix]|eukprot:PSC73110.1 CREG1 [Micractinium conductrix]